jgi:hypothetical protein
MGSYAGHDACRTAVPGKANGHSKGMVGPPM